MTRPCSERFRMVRPDPARRPRRRLLPPAIGIHHIHLSIAVDIADPESVTCTPGSLRRDVMNDPLPCWIGRIGLGVAQKAAAPIDVFQLAIAVDVFKQ